MAGFKVQGPNKADLLGLERMGDVALSVDSFDISIYAAFNEDTHTEAGWTYRKTSEVDEAVLMRTGRIKHLSERVRTEEITNAQLARKLTMGWTGNWGNGQPYTVPARDIVGQFIESDYWLVLKENARKAVVAEVKEQMAKGFEAARKTSVSIKKLGDDTRMNIADAINDTIAVNLPKAMYAFLQTGSLMPVNSEWWAEKKGNNTPGVYSGALSKSFTDIEVTNVWD